MRTGGCQSTSTGLILPLQDIPLTKEEQARRKRKLPKTCYNKADKKKQEDYNHRINPPTTIKVRVDGQANTPATTTQGNDDNTPVRDQELPSTSRRTILIDPRKAPNIKTTGTGTYKRRKPLAKKPVIQYKSFNMWKDEAEGPCVRKATMSMCMDLPKVDDTTAPEMPLPTISERKDHQMSDNSEDEDPISLDTPTFPRQDVREDHQQVNILFDEAFMSLEMPTLPIEMLGHNNHLSDR